MVAFVIVEIVVLINHIYNDTNSEQLVSDKNSNASSQAEIQGCLASRLPLQGCTFLSRNPGLY